MAAAVVVPDFIPGASSFLGRDGHLAELGALLERSRLVTLTGAPGIGKSRLALELAGRHFGGDADGTRLVELAPVPEGALVVGAVASALSVQEVPGQRVVETLVARVGERPLLLVLDNCEHLIDAAAEMAEALLGGCPELRIVATSREQLGIAAERVWEVPPLATPTRGVAPLPDALQEFAAVRLFVDRAAAVQPDFVLGPYVSAAVAEVCRRLDGIPLAIELAAARVETLTPAEIAARLDDRFGLLTEGSRDGVARHRTLRAALDWSYGLLSTSERALLRRLAVFRGGFDREAVEAVCAGGDVEPAEVPDVLARLVSRSLVVADASGRHRLLETVRAYAGDRLGDAHEAAALRQAHARFCLALAEEAEPGLTGPDQERWLARLEAERANLRSALEWSLARGDGELALRLAGALVLFWRVRCHFSEAREMLEAALGAGEGTAPARAKALWGAGFMAVMMIDPDHALPLLDESLACFRALGDSQGEARALLLLGNCWQHRDSATALSLLDHSATVAREAGDAWCLAHALAVAGFEHCRRQAPAVARPLFEECLAVARAAQDKQGLRFGLLGLACAAMGVGDYRAAEPVLEEADAIVEELGEDYTKASVSGYLGLMALNRGDYRRAGSLFDASAALVREVGPAVKLVVPLVGRAAVARVAGDKILALRLLEEALALARADPVPGMPDQVLSPLGELALEEGDRGAARRLFTEALAVARARGDAGDRRGVARALYGLGQLARTEEEDKRAAVLHNEALELQREIGFAPGIALSLEAVGGLAAAAGRCRQATELFGAATRVREAAGCLRPPWGSPRYDADLAVVRAALSHEEFEVAFSEGAMLSPEAVTARTSRNSDSTSRPSNGWASLTEGERRVAAMVAEGLTNPEIAERLFVSLGTVKDYLSRSFSKLGIARRAELAREFLRHEGQDLGGQR